MRASNNTAELQGLAEALRYLLHVAAPGVPALITSDSEYAIDAMLGLTAAKQNRQMVRAVRDLWDTARAARRSGGQEGLFVRHIHSQARRRGRDGHEWNKTADRLAARGRRVSCGVWVRRGRPPPGASGWFIPPLRLVYTHRG